MKLEVGLKFKKNYGDDNLNNIDSCEVRGIVDNYIIVLWCERKATKLREYKEFYLSIDTQDFNFNVKHGIYQEL